MSSLGQSQAFDQVGAKPLSSILAADMLAESPKDGKSVVSESRGEAKVVLTEGGIQPPVDPGKPELSQSRDKLIGALRLESQYEARGDALVELMAHGIFAEGVPLPTYGQVLKAFTTDHLRIALGYQEPMLLMVPTTSLRAKMKAMDKAMAIIKKRVAKLIRPVRGVSKEARESAERARKWGRVMFATEVVEKLSDKVDAGSKMVTGWRAVIMDGADEIDPKAMGDETGLNFDERILRLRKNRRLGESGMDLHSYSMFVLEKLMRGEMISEWFVTLCDNDMEAFSPHLPHIISYREQDVMVAIYLAVHRDSRYVRFRRSIGGEIKP